MSTLRDVLDQLPIDDRFLRRLPIPALQDRCLLEIDLGRGLLEGSPSTPIEALRSRHTPNLRQVVDGLRRAAGDDKVAGLVVHAASGISAAQAGELRRAVLAFRSADKPTLAWTESFGELTSGTIAYLVASACDEVWLQPSGDVNLSGSVAGGLFLRGALDKLGLVPQFARRREYKSAAELYLNESMSEPNREMLDRIVESLDEQIAAEVASARRLDGSVVRELLRSGPLPARQARESGLVDRIGYRDEAIAHLRERIGDVDDEVELRYVERYRSGPSLPKRGRPVVALVEAQGAIHLGRSGAGGARHSIGSDTLGAALREAGRDKHVRAVVLRVDSPGGSYVASDAIRREVLRLREQGTPVVASMAGVAASGGYFISMPCDRILADAATLTGSIGVLAGKVVVREGLLRLGVNVERVSRGPFDEMFSAQRRFSDEEWARLDSWLDEVYADFTSKAAADRDLPHSTLEPLARGRVWTGADAVAKGLVDEVGGLEEAIVAACAAARVERDDAEVRPVPKLGPFDRLMPADSSESPVGVRLGEGASLFDRATAALGLAPFGVLSMPPVRVAS